MPEVVWVQMLTVPVGSDGEHGDVAASHAAHLLVKLFIKAAQTVDEGILLLALGIVHRELATFFSQVYR